jgi:hypothetical protein
MLTACKSTKMYSTYEGKYIHISKDLSDTTFLVLNGDSTFVFYGNIYPPSYVGQNWLCQSVKGSWTPKRNKIELKRNTEVFDDNKLGLAQFQKKGACIYPDSVELQFLNNSNGLPFCLEDIPFFRYSTDTVVYFVKPNKDGVIYFSPKPNEAFWISLDAVGRLKIIQTSNFEAGFSYKFQYINCYPLFDKKEILLIKSGYLIWNDGVRNMKFLRINKD